MTFSRSRLLTLRNISCGGLGKGGVRDAALFAGCLLNDFYFFSQTSLASTLGNLKDYVVKRRCQQESIVTFLSQVASALHYLHTKHIVHGDLRAMYVMVVSPDQVIKPTFPKP